MSKPPRAQKIPPLQLLNLANDVCGEHALVVKPHGEPLALRVAAASFAETYACPDPTCRPDVRLTTDGGITAVTIHHDDECAELRRRSAKARRQRRATRRKAKR